ncbi:hypothetical protein Q5752_000101 [Cryptotrichosporon argae]
MDDRLRDMLRTASASATSTPSSHSPHSAEHSAASPFDYSSTPQSGPHAHPALAAHAPPPPPHPLTQQASSSSSIPQASSHSIPTQHPASPREPTPAPPPQSLQSISLASLFPSLGAMDSAAAGAPNVAPSAAQPRVTTPQDHKERLLGMLSGFAPTPVERVPSGKSTPDSHKAALLGALKSPTQPVIHHPTAPAPPPNASAALAALTQSALKLAPEPAAAPVAPITPAPALPAQPPAPPVQAPSQPPAPAPPAPAVPSKSPFEFVSPFDAFGSPTSSKPAPQPTLAVPNGSAKQPAAAPAPVAVKGPAAAERQLPPPSTTSPVVKSQPHSRNESPVPEPKPKAASIAFDVKQWEGKGKGPQALHAHTVFDLSQPNTDVLVTAKAVRTTATTIMSTEPVYTRGRLVSATQGFFAYVLKRGRVRLIDRVSAKKAVLQLPPTAAGAIVDIAVTADAVAAVTADGSVTTFSTPSHWEKDDPSTSLVFHLAPGGDSPIGPAYKAEWVKRDSGRVDWLAIGGPEGVALVRPADFTQTASATDIFASTSVLRGSGPIVDFCLNATQQAIGLLSSTSFFTLYSAASLARVWNRQLPSASSAAPCSVAFCDTNILVGREQDTLLELVQITTEIGVLSSLRLQGGGASAFARVAYDAARGILFVAPFARASVLALRYALRGQPGLKPIPAAGVVGFDRVAEFPAEPIVSFVLTPKHETIECDMFFASPKGISEAALDVTVLESAARPAAEVRQEPTRPAAPASAQPGALAVQAPAQPAVPAQPPAQPPVQPAVVQTRTATVGPTLPTPSAAPAAPAERKPDTAAKKRGKKADVAAESASTSPVKAKADLPEEDRAVVGADELAKVLKRTEDRMLSSVKTTVQLEVGVIYAKVNERSETVAAELAKNLEERLPGLIKAEFKKQIFPALGNALQADFDALARSLPRTLRPDIERAIDVSLARALPAALVDTINTAITPALSAAAGLAYEQLATDIRSEMLQVRKEAEGDFGKAVQQTNGLIRGLAEQVEALRKQVAALEARPDRAAAANVPASVPTQLPAVHPPAPVHHAPAPLAVVSPPAPVPVRTGVAVAVPTANYDDVFIRALSVNSVQATNQLVREYWAKTDEVLPSGPGAKSPLSAAVLLTLLHRLALALSELTPGDPTLFILATWEERVAELVDPRDPAIASYVGRVLPTARQLLLAALDRAAQAAQFNPQCASMPSSVRAILDVLARKA